MKVVQPFKVTESSLIYSNVPIDDYPEYDDGDTYVAPDRVIVLSVLSVFECVSETPIGGISPLDPEGAAVWLRVGAVNRWKAFDKIIGGATEGEWEFDPAVFSSKKLEPGFDPLEEPDMGIAYHLRTNTFVDTLSIFNVSAFFVDVVVETDDGIQYAKRVHLGGPLLEANWFTYFNEPLYRVDRINLTNLPTANFKDIYISAVELTEGEEPKIGEIVLGRAIDIGKSLYGTSLGFLDFSTKERNEFGGFEIVERDYADELEVDLSIENDKIFFIRQVLADLRAVPTVYIPSECIDGTSVYGIVSEFSIVITGPKRSNAVLKVLGLI